MANCHDIVCPECGSDNLEVRIAVWATLTEDGSDIEGQDHEYDNSSACQCKDCGHAAPLGEFPTDMHRVDTDNAQR